MNIVWYLGWFICFFTPTQSWAFIEDINAFRTQMMSSRNQFEDKLWEPPQFSTLEKVSEELYEGKRKNLGMGQDAVVSLAVSKIDRPRLGLRAGQQIVLRAVKTDTKFDMASNKKTLQNFARLEILRKNKITEFFPAFYGCYLAQGTHRYSSSLLQFEEMEMVNTSFAKKYNCGLSHNYREPKPIVSICTALEFCLGEWAGAYFAGIGSHDAKPDNWGIQEVNYGRKYVIGGKTFSFLSSSMPKRIDVGGAGEFNEDDQKSLRYKFSCSLSKYSNNSDPGFKGSNELKTFLDTLPKERHTSIIDVFESFYPYCKKEQEELGTDPLIVETKEFVWPSIVNEKYIPKKRSQIPAVTPYDRLDFRTTAYGENYSGLKKYEVDAEIYAEEDWE